MREKESNVINFKPFSLFENVVTLTKSIKFQIVGTM